MGQGESDPILMEHIAGLASRLIDLSIRLDDDDEYEEFSDIVDKLITALNVWEGRPNWDDI